MTYEKDIVKNIIRFYLVDISEKLDKPLNIDDCISCVAALIFPCAKEIDELEIEEIQGISEYLSKNMYNKTNDNLKKDYKHLADYSFISLARIFKDKWITDMPLKEKKRLLPKRMFIADIDDEGNVDFNEKLYNAYAGIKHEPQVLSDDYGTKEYNAD